MSEGDAQPRPEGPPARLFVGREDELDVAERALAAAAAGSRSLLLLSGEAGIGKSALAHEIATLARRRQMHVAWGRCRESEGAPAYWPWNQILRTCANVLTSPITDVSARGIELLGRIAPEVTGGEVFELDDDGGDERARFELAHAVTRLLHQVAVDVPLLLVLEDIHQADPGTLHLLAHLVAHLETAPIVIAATFRPGELTREAEDVTSRLASAAETIHLEGLGRADARTLVTGLAPEIHPSVADAVADFTGGQPLFAREVVRMLATERRLGAPLDPGTRLTVPTGVRDVIRRRTTPLPEPVAEVVATAAVIGEEFEFSLLQAVTGFPAPTLLEHVGAALTEGIFDEAPGLPARYRFHHALLRTVVHEELHPPARAELHRRVADAMETLHDADLEPRRSELAHHLYEAAAVVDPRRVADAAVAAGERALHLLAFGEAERHFQAALDVLASAGLSHGEKHADLLLALGSAQRRAGRRTTRATLREAFAVARRHHDARRMAMAALAMQVGVATIGTESVVDQELAAHLEEALHALGPDHPDLRARVVAMLAETYYWGEPIERAHRLGAEAVALAETVDDDTVLARALVAHHYASWTPDNTDERRGIADRILDLATRSRALEIAFMAHSARITVMLETGDMAAVDRELDDVERVAASLGQPVVAWALERWRATRAIIDGRIDAGVRHMDAAVALAEDTQYPAPIIEYWAIQSYAVHVARGTLAEVADGMRVNARQRSAPGYRSALAALEAELGNTTAARVEVERFFADGLPAIRRDLAWMTTIGALCVATASVGEPSWCEELYQFAAPLSHRCIVVGDGTQWNGPLAQWLAPVAARAGHGEEAERLFDRAVTVNRRAGALPHLVMTLRRYAEFLAARGRTEDADRRRRFIEEALEICDRCGLDGHRATLLALAETSAPANPSASAPGPVLGARLHRDGEHWTAGLGEDRVLLRDLRGLHYLSRLIESPGREFHVLDLAGARSSTTARRDPDSIASGGGLGPDLDDEAKRAYRARLRELRDDADEAERMGDGERAARARAEIDALTEQLARAVGLGGRDRVTGSDAERARVAVTKAIRTAIGRIGEHLPGLSAHLEVSVQTGTYCTYAPDPATRVEWTRGT